MTSPSTDRSTRAPVVSGALALLLGAVLVAVSVGYNRGSLVPPLDDVYIHLQYARQFGDGEPLRFQPGAEITTGASSLLWMVLLGAAHAVGFDGRWLLAVAVVGGVVGVACATGFTSAAATRLGGRAAGWWAGLLTALCGPLLWGGASGMEVGLLAALTTGTLLSYLRERPRFRATPVVAALLALTRPEGFLLAAAFTAAMAWTLLRPAPGPAARAGRPWGRLALVAVPVVVFAGQLLLYRVLTRTSQANGVLAKSWLHTGFLRQPLEIADHVQRNLAAILASLSGLSGQDVLAPLALVLAVLGVAVLAARRERVLAVVLGGGLASVVLAVATLTTAMWQDLRYLQPFLPLLLLLVVLGAGLVGNRAARTGLLAVVLLFALAATPAWALRLGQQASAMREGPVSVAQWIAGNVPPGDAVAVNDVGAAAWFGGHRTVDLVGLTTNGMAAPSLNGPGTLYEALRALPGPERPQWFAVFDRWGGVPVADLGRAGLLGAEPVITFGLAGPARPISASAPQTCQLDRSCDRVSIWRADWSAADSAQAPDLPVPGRIVDHLNVGDMADEAAHGWTTDPPVLGVQPDSVLDRAVVAPGRLVADSGRHVVGGETFTLGGTVPGRPVTLTGRIGAGPALPGERTRVVAVDVDGRPAGEWTLPDAQPWAQASFTVPGELVTGDRVTVTTRPVAPLLAPYPDYRSYGWWASR
ncbi:hypothetical protein FVA95_19400 [Pseudonocardia sp. EV170527-09]|uniref:hypothetical protein n=1 Tax=Pseudonocardia sp. EV170527-09 TaxID=2603411 RepID=UPI0011F160A4|nr:hypothetical protein [Pseudonocardia sp. EV170527-09]KAA1022361.1 hypothetical protein FVA95_19400 [Pseudonocardia sp. EV170527-09]